ncbi:hypothetical protein V6N11_064933 [Hibiscus sabdariffa]|uniref:Uncharacterized protein n=1 Tax=Hibiscus sabdariffa TaxID=183260 RepID=A0ABR2SIG5_9ROSI
MMGVRRTRVVSRSGGEPWVDGFGTDDGKGRGEWLRQSVFNGGEAGFGTGKGELSGMVSDEDGGQDEGVRWRFERW